MSEIVTYCGRPIHDMSREELIKTVLALGRQLKDAHLSHERSLETWRLFREAREARSAL